MPEGPEYVNLMLLNTVGLSILTHTLRAAGHFFYLKSTSRRSETAQCYAFIQGSGLHALIRKYDLNLDADQLREGFNYYLKRKH